MKIFRIISFFTIILFLNCEAIGQSKNAISAYSKTKIKRYSNRPQTVVNQTVSYNSNCLKIDGKETFVYSAAFHYFRCPKELWRDRFQKIKDAGFNTVE
ncbi:MAG: beta-galactosidase, partial [Ginsengibacter sp.]